MSTSTPERLLSWKTHAAAQTSHDSAPAVAAMRAHTPARGRPVTTAAGAHTECPERKWPL
jgi:hypothetical protein